jgi:hypothetical protein
MDDDDVDIMPQHFPVLRRADGGLGPDIHDPFGIFPEGVTSFPYNLNPHSHTQGRRVVRTDPPEIPLDEWVIYMIDLISCYLEVDIAVVDVVITPTNRRWITQRIDILKNRINNPRNTDTNYVVDLHTALVNRLDEIIS